MLTVLIIVFGLSFLIFIHELGHFLVAKFSGILVEEFGFGYPPRLFAKKIGETVYSVNILPFGGFVKIYGMSRDYRQGDKKEAGGKMEIESKEAIASLRDFRRKPVWRRAFILFAGIFMNFLVGWFIVSIIYCIGTPSMVLITDLKSNSPAAGAGFLKNDILDGFSNTDEFIQSINQNKGKEISLDVRRGKERLSLKVVPRMISPEGEGPLGVSIAEIGIPKEASLLKSFKEGLKSSLAAIGMIFSSLFKIVKVIFTEGRLTGEFVGPVGIFDIAFKVGQMGAVYVLQLLALISLNLTALNLLPFPALDGGHLLFILIEKIKGSPLPARTEELINGAGFAILLFLMIAITVKDIIRLF